MFSQLKNTYCATQVFNKTMLQHYVKIPKYIGSEVTLLIF